MRESCIDCFFHTPLEEEGAVGVDLPAERKCEARVDPLDFHEFDAEGIGAFLIEYRKNVIVHRTSCRG